jgi:GNAT superfamily N-acetyltransferase
MARLRIETARAERLDTLVEMRLDFIRDLHPEYTAKLLDGIRTATKPYFQELLTQDAYVGFLGSDDTGATVCSAGLLLYSLPPLNADRPRKIGHVLNFFTRPGCRRKGYGTELMEFMKAWAKDAGLHRLFLNATAMGLPLYAKSGFIEPDDKVMILNL